MTRTFVAVVPPLPIREAIAAAIEPHREGFGDVRWVEPENLHFTLRFFGDLGERDLESAFHATDIGIEKAAAFDLTLGGIGAFPNVRRPSVWWIGVEQGASELEVVARSLERAYRDARLGRADKPFRSHLTVGRVRRPRDRKAPKTFREIVAQRDARSAAGSPGEPASAPVRPRTSESPKPFHELTFPPLTFRVSSVEVIASSLSPRGARYTSLHTVRLPEIVPEP